MQFILVLLMLPWGTTVFADALCEPSLASQEQRIAKARAFMERNPSRFSEKFHTFQIADESVRIQFAKEMAARESGEDGDESRLNRYIQNYNITDQQALVEIAKLYALQSGNIANGFKNFGIRNESDRIEIAKVAAQVPKQYPPIAENFENFEIKDPAALREILDLLVENRDSDVEFYLSKFLITSEAERAAIIQRVLLPISFYGVEKKLNRFSEFNISDPHLIYEIAKTVTTHHPSEFAEYRSVFSTLSEKEIIELAKIAAASDNAYRFHEFFENLNIQSEADRFAIAKVAAANPKSGVRFARDFANYRISKPEWRIELAKLAASAADIDDDDEDAFGGTFRNFQLEDPEAIFEVAKIYFSSKGTYGSPRFIRNFQIESESRRMELARLLIASDHGNELITYIEDFELHDRKNRLELAELLAVDSPDNFSRYFKEFKIEDRALRLKFATLAAANGMSGCSVVNFGIEDRKELLKLAYLSAATSTQFAACIDNFGVESAEDKFALAKLSAGAPQNFSFPFSIANFDLTTEEQRLEVAKIWIRGSGDRYAVLDRHGIRFPLEERDSRIELARAYLTSGRIVDNDMIRAALTLVDGNNAPNLRNLPHEQVLTFLRPLKMIESNRLEQFGSTFQRTDVLMGLWIAQIAADTEPTPCPKCAAAKNAQEFVMAWIGLDSTAAHSFLENSIDTQGELVALMFEVMRKLDRDFLIRNPIDSQLLQKRNAKDFIKLLVSIRDLLELTDDEFTKSQLTAGLTAQRLPELLQVFRDKRARSVSEMFGMDITTFNGEQFDKLSELWGDLDPFFTLIARFRGQERWQKEIPILGKVFTSVLNGNFYDLKFKGLGVEAKVQEQLKNLGSLEEWAKTRFRLNDIREADAATQTALEARTKAISDLMESNLLPHTLEITEDRICPEKMAADLQSLLASGPIDKFGADKKDQRVPLRCLNDALKISIAEGSDKISLKILKALLKEKERLTLTTTLLDDVASLDKILRGESVSAKEGLSLTLNFWDPKWLLMVGDLVKTGSCQSYKTGSHIETLLGYVLDANVQGIASFVIAPNNFSNRNEYDAVTKAMQNKQILNLEMDSQFRAHIQTPEGRITTSPLGNAYLRHILKLGQTADGGVGVRLERAYQQVHNAGPLMKTQVDEIVEEIKTSIAARPGPISMPRTRNPLGIYSDSAGGIKTDAYCIQ